MRIFATDRYYQKLLDSSYESNKDIGILGEKEVFRRLKPLHVNKYPGFIIPNYKFKLHDENIECDFIIVTSCSIIILEVKNWKDIPEVNDYGEIKNLDRDNIQSQVERQKMYLEQSIKNDLGIHANVNYIITISSGVKNINNKIYCDFSSVLSKIITMINGDNIFFDIQTQQFNDLPKLFDYFKRNNKNTFLEWKNYLDSKDYDFLDNRSVVDNYYIDENSKINNYIKIKEKEFNHRLDEYENIRNNLEQKLQSTIIEHQNEIKSLEDQIKQQELINSGNYNMQKRKLEEKLQLTSNEYQKKIDSLKEKISEQEKYNENNYNIETKRLQDKLERTTNEFKTKLVALEQKNKDKEISEAQKYVEALKKLNNKNKFEKIFYELEHKKPSRGFNIYIPNKLLKSSINNKNSIDDRFFAVLYNLLTFRTKQLNFHNLEDIKQHPNNLIPNAHCLLLLSLILIKNNKFKINDETICLPIQAKDVDVEKIFLIIYNHLVDLFSEVSDIKKYNIKFSGDYKVVFKKNEDKFEDDKCVYIVTEQAINSSEQAFESEEPTNSSKQDVKTGIWKSSNIKYDFSKSSEFLEKIIEYIFGFYSFNDGQKESIISAFENNQNQVIMLPTGQGKSLIFYLLLLLQPKQGLIIYPTSILINNQIENLNGFGFKNINNFDETKEVDDSLIQMMLPSNILQKEVLEYFIKKSDDLSFSYIILDEVHCLSKYSHDFRPEYFLLHDKLNYYLDNIRIKGFTATATWDVLNDLMTQFNMSSNDIYSPNINRNNIYYSIKKVNKAEKHKIIKEDIQDSCEVHPDEKVLVFTKDKSEIDDLREIDKHDEYEYLDGQNESAEVIQFIRNSYIKALISNNDIGVGIDLPNINTIIHYSQPLSIADYTQQVGRGGRRDYTCSSIVYYDPNEELKKTNKLKDIDIIIENTYNDLKKAYSNGYTWAKSNININNLESYKFVYFCYYQLGIISEWWIENEGSFGLSINRETSLNLNSILRYIYNNFINEKELQSSIRNCKDIVSIVRKYYEWYLYWHDTFKRNSFNRMKKLLQEIVSEQYDNNQIQELINEDTYYSNVELANIDSFKEYTFDELMIYFKTNKKLSINIDKFRNDTNINIQMIVFVKNLKMDILNVEEYNRIINVLTMKERFEFFKVLLKINEINKKDLLLELMYSDIYNKLNTKEKIEISNLLDDTVSDKYKYLYSFSIMNDYIQGAIDE